MSQFQPGEVKTARITMRNPTGKAFNYNGCIYMGTDLAVVSEKPFDLAAGEEKQVGFPVTMPSAPGIYPVHVGVFCGGQNVALYKSVEAVQILVPEVEIVRSFIRPANPEVSEAFSGWIGFSPIGAQLNLALHGAVIQVGAVIRNPTGAVLKLTPAIYNYHWVEPNDYITTDYDLPSVEPQRFPPAPTGMPYSFYEYQADKLLLPGGEISPGQTAFVYTDLYSQSRRWNYVYLQLQCNGYDLGRTLLYWGWYSY